MISHEYKCIFVHIPKCAGTSIEVALGHFDDHEGREGQDHRSIRMIEQPLIIPQIFYSKGNFYEFLRRLKYKNTKVRNPLNKLTVTKEQYKSYYKFTIIRNPWARAFSWYKNVMRDQIHQQGLKLSSDTSFKDFLRKFAGKGMLRPQTYWLRSFNGLIQLDHIGRFENLIKDFQKVCTHLQLSRPNLPHKIRGTGEDYREHYDEESINIISNIYHEEIEKFNYSFDL